MELEITPCALEKLDALNNSNFKNLLLWYDIDGCGCGVNGVNRIVFSDDIKQTYCNVDSDQGDFAVWIEQQQIIFFDEKMYLDYKNGMFRLSAASEILNGFISPQSLLQSTAN